MRARPTPTLTLLALLMLAALPASSPMAQEAVRPPVPEAAGTAGTDGGEAAGCQAPAPVCAAADSVYAIAGFTPLASAVRVEPDRLVTARHAVADLDSVEVFTHDGRRLVAAVVPTDYPGDLILLQVDGLGDGPVAAVGQVYSSPVWVVGADVDRGSVHPFESGQITAEPAAGYPLSRLHVDAQAQPRTSGGGLFDADGRLLGIVAAGGEGRNEAVPATDIERLQRRSGDDYSEVSKEVGTAVRQCFDLLERPEAFRTLGAEGPQRLAETCIDTGNRQYFDRAGQALVKDGDLALGLDLFRRSLAQDPNGPNTRLSYAIALHMAGDYKAEIEQLHWLLEHLPDDPRVLRLAVQAGKWGNAPDLVETALARIAESFPQQLEAARRFVTSDTPPPKPAGRTD